MLPRDRLLALLVAVCWGVNFPATTLALQHFPPLLMLALRFTLIAIPTMIFVPNRGFDSSNAVGNFCFEVSLSYRRGDRPYRVNNAGLTC